MEKMIDKKPSWKRSYVFYEEKTFKKESSNC